MAHGWVRSIRPTNEEDYMPEKLSRRGLFGLGAGAIVASSVPPPSIPRSKAYGLGYKITREDVSSSSRTFPGFGMARVKTEGGKIEYD